MANPELYSIGEIQRVKEIKTASDLHRAVTHLIKRAIRFDYQITPSRNALGFLERRLPALFTPTHLSNELATIDNGSGEGLLKPILTSTHLIENTPPHLQEVIRFTLGTDNDIYLMAEKTGRAGTDTSSITLTSTPDDLKADRITARADNDMLTFATIVNGDLRKLEERNLDRRYTLTQDLVCFADDQLALELATKRSNLRQTS